MSSEKTISINPSLFRIGGAKTRKNNKNNNKQRKYVKPLINPNILKNKLLKRIKEHKQNETKDIDKKNKEENNDENEKMYENELSESINFLESLSKQKKKENLDNIIKNKTIKRPISSPQVNIELSEELQPVQMNNEICINTSLTPVILNKPVFNDNVPYGVLKGGKKPTYRNWLKTSNNTVQQPIQNNLQYIDRENRLHNLREKLKNKERETTNTQTNNTQELHVETNNTQELDNIQTNINNVEEYVLNPNEEIIGNKKTTKKITKKTYTLGKFKNQRKIGVLIKNRDTRKKIINAQRDLKKKPIQEIKNYLKEHNLIKIGGNAPNDVIHKLYESAILCGEITNTNSDTLLHNFSKLEKHL